jgi:hypothetical protein
VQRHGRVQNRTQNDPNEIIIINDIAEICLYDVQGKERARAIIDVEDIKKIEKHKWYLSAQGYVQAHIEGGLPKIQHIILDVKPNMREHIDHINGNRIDNRRANLRFCVSAENARNRGKQKNNKSGYKGVYNDGKSPNWAANIRVDKKTIYIGTFKNIIDAARAYNRAATKYHGDFARLNEIRE